jgi:hypothetical protein
MVRGIEDPISDEVPHLRIAILQVLFHPQDDLVRLVMAVSHLPKLC